MLDLGACVVSKLPRDGVKVYALHRASAQGYQGSFYQKPITYFDHDGLVYWTMGGPVEETSIINRCPKEQSYEYKRDHGLLPEQQEPSR